ncbi:hypothetical protein BIV57_09070 [Mangrovactinospora gilvigrisea]|uniref:Uncharacterized protein n=1 Tax=Mangrovactinospora gilvigrisea TaxID=1428644 RepID=A0A1J7CDI3_9ACTN|nr:hypothetical protein [Mangrovactinospora gilvigrisea]OIV37722.1 hypothetical protein BIV57_09070 [Mangrovactinospora gilvigrisea]
MAGHITTGGRQRRRRLRGLAGLLRRPRTLPALLVRAGTGCAALAVAAGAVLAVDALHTRADVNRMGGTDGPQVEEAAGIYLAINDMDAQVANMLMLGADRTFAAERADDQRRYRAARSVLDSDLQQAADHGGGNTAAARAVVRVLDGSGDYQAAAARALQLDDAAHAPAGAPPAAAVAQYRTATDMLRGPDGLLASAQALIDANNRAMLADYDARHAALGAAAGWTAGLGGAALLALLALQVHLARSFGRILNPALAAATAAVLFVLAGGIAWASWTRGDLHRMRHDAFDSVVALSSARATAHDANADESRYLLDRGRRAEYEASYLAKEQRLASVGRVPSVDDYRGDYSGDRAAYLTDHGNRLFGGDLRREVDNITFPGEQRAAVGILNSYQVYIDDDLRIRQLERAGKVRQAVAFCTDWGSGGSNWAFARLDGALRADLAINRGVFESTAAHGASAATALAPAVAGAALLAAVLVPVGLRPRLREFEG